MNYSSVKFIIPNVEYLRLTGKLKAQYFEKSYQQKRCIEIQ